GLVFHAGHALLHADLFIGINDGDDFAILAGKESVQVVLTAAIAAENRHAQPLVRAVRLLAVREQRSDGAASNGGRRGEHGLLQKLTTRLPGHLTSPAERRIEEYVSPRRGLILRVRSI